MPSVCVMPLCEGCARECVDLSLVHPSQTGGSQTDRQANTHLHTDLSVSLLGESVWVPSRLPVWASCLPRGNHRVSAHVWRRCFGGAGWRQRCPQRGWQMSEWMDTHHDCLPTPPNTAVVCGLFAKRLYVIITHPRTRTLSMSSQRTHECMVGWLMWVYVVCACLFTAGRGRCVSLSLCRRMVAGALLCVCEKEVQCVCRGLFDSRRCASCVGVLAVPMLMAI